MRSQRKITRLFAFVLGLFLLGFSLAAGSSPALVSVGRTTEAPLIDGKLDDAAWKHCVEIGPFVACREDAFAEQPTSVFITYDDLNIYFAFRCHEECLQPLNNQLEEFKKKSVSDDENALFWKDDIVCVLLAPEPAEKKCYDIFVNANGAVNDALCRGDTPSALWKKRDVSWNSNAKAASFLDDKGYWTLEMAIPFASLGRKAPSGGENWLLCLGRIRQKKRQVSSWIPMSKGFHDWASFGRMKLVAEEVPGIRNISFGNLKTGENDFSFQALPFKGERQLRVQTFVDFISGRPCTEFKDFNLKPTSADFVYRFFLNGKGKFSFSYRFTDPSTLKAFYISPAYKTELKTRYLKAQINNSSGFECFLNGRKLTGTGKKLNDFSGILLAGVNSVAIKTGGIPEGSFSVGDFKFGLGKGWKFSEKAQEGWNGRFFDDSAWKVLSNVKEFTTAKKTLYLRKNILVGFSETYPNWIAQKLTVVRDSDQSLIFYSKGIKGRKLEDYRFFLEVPEDMSVTASGYFGSEKKGFKCSELKDWKGRKGFRRYVIKALHPIHWKKTYNETSGCCAVVKVPETYNEKDTFFYYGIEAEGGSVAELPQKLPVSVLPLLKEKSPKKIVWLTSTGILKSMDDSVCREELLDTLKKAGFNSLWYGRNPKPQKKIPFVNVVSFAMKPWIVDCTSYLKKHPGDGNVDKDGKHSKYMISPSLLVRDGEAWDFLEKAIAEYIRKYRVDNMNWDYEYSVWPQARHYFKEGYYDFSELGISDFRKFAKLPENTKLNYEIIRRDYAKQWIAFMDQRMAVLCGRLRNAVKKANPKCLFSVYSCYESEEAHETYGVNWNLFADKIDQAICGYGRPLAAIEETEKILKRYDVPLVCGDLLTPYDSTARQFPTYSSKAVLLRRLVDSTGGILIWHFRVMDGRTLYASSEIAALAADCEDFFLKRNKDNSLVTVSGISPDDFTVYTLDGGMRRLLLFINESDSERNITILNNKMQPGMRVFDYFENKYLDGDSKIQVKIAPNDVKAYIIQKGEFTPWKPAG